MNKKIYSCADALNEVNVLVNFVTEKGTKMTIEELFNVVDSVNIIKNKIVESDVIDTETKDNFWYWYKELYGVKNMLYDLERILFNLQDVVEG